LHISHLSLTDKTSPPRHLCHQRTNQSRSLTHSKRSSPHHRPLRQFSVNTSFLSSHIHPPTSLQCPNTLELSVSLILNSSPLLLGSPSENYQKRVEQHIGHRPGPCRATLLNVSTDRAFIGTRLNAGILRHELQKLYLRLPCAFDCAFACVAPYAA
jgi:hypothetical protein